jgi:dephospho-CoA kinase
VKVIGLTGGIAAGKSTFSSMLRTLGARVIDADAISRGLTEPGGAALEGIRGRFGCGVFDGGKLNRAALAGIVFSSELERRALESIIHPLVISESRARLSALRESGARVAVLEAPLLIEAGMDRMCGEVWVVYAPESVRLERLMKRDGLTLEQARARIASQTSFAEKARRADLILPTTGLRSDICAMASRQWARITES